MGADPYGRQRRGHHPHLVTLPGPGAPDLRAALFRTAWAWRAIRSGTRLRAPFFRAAWARGAAALRADRVFPAVFRAAFFRAGR